MDTFKEAFSHRHIGPSQEDQMEMLNFLQTKSLGELVNKSTPQSIRLKSPLDLQQGLSESEFLERAKEVASKNKVFKSFIGLGYYGTKTPGVIQRNILENPLWYTAYTPYQAEISQGRMEALLNFQTMIIDLTKLPIANSSLLDEGTAVAEAINMAYAVQRKDIRNKVLVDKNIFPQSLAVVKTRIEALGLELVIDDIFNTSNKEDFFAVVCQYPNALGEVCNYSQLSQDYKQAGAKFIAAADLLSLCLLKAPGEWGADIAVGTTQRFGVPFGFGGPHAAYLACNDEFKRLIPGRIIGMSKDVHDQPALRLALQTREQHIRREKATSNICTAQVLLAVMSSMYAVYHGPHGLKRIAKGVQQKTQCFFNALKSKGYKVLNQTYFDTLTIEIGEKELEKYKNKALEFKINLGQWDKQTLLVSFDEVSSLEDLDKLFKIFGITQKPEDFLTENLTLPNELIRESSYLSHPVFNKYHSETEMLRYITELQSKDLSLAHAMIPLGSCTMKLNASSEMQPITWPEFANIHPFAPLDQALGYMEMIHQLENWLSEVTGFAGVSLQPNAGSQGEYAGLLVVKKYLESQGQSHRNICLIPSSAHGTNPASAVMAGMKVVVVKCDDEGNIDLVDLDQKISDNKDSLAALMVTYPSTHGVFEESIREICEKVHSAGGQVYMDGANLNALVGIAQPGEFGPDVCHLNLHKTFCIPHGGGGPGIGPIGVAPHLVQFLPNHPLVKECGGHESIGAIAAAPWGSASILPISWGYMAMMGREGLTQATQVAILNANYIAKKLEPYYPILYRGKEGWVAHECIIDVRKFKTTCDISVDDIAKRLIDYGFHAPTMSWPVAGTLMIEPTESESKFEIDRFIEAMISIREEIKEVEEGTADPSNNVLKNAPHSLSHLTTDNWTHPYSREKAAYPLTNLKLRKFWAPVGRVDNAYGDRNLVCSCNDLLS
ncbi:MAG: aminomethyl-transferring glycine dehydrogenase [Bdellovibrionales bacterium]|nr:aminomethyl-transferring glycine dehydrogenase [Bdellovibrionales bacterium]